jgi:hypothetical protein
MAEPATRKPYTAPHRELLVQMQINRSNATAGGSGANVLRRSVTEFTNQGGGAHHATFAAGK